MGKRTGVTKSGRVMNPADRERKQMRLKELKRNKKQRLIVRNSIVKSRNPEDLIEQMIRMDEQEFDPTRELSLNVILEKRSKMRGAYIQIIALYRQEKDDKKVKNLERLLHEYEIERFRKEQNFKAKLFSENANPDEIPLPCGAMDPEAAKTPFTAMPMPAIVPKAPVIKAGILKRAQIGPTVPAKKHMYPPGPPRGLPPNMTDSEEEYSDEDVDQDIGRRTRSKSRRVRFDEEQSKQQQQEEEEEYAPVEIPDSMLNAESQRPHQSHQQSLPVYSRGPPPTLMGNQPVGPAPTRIYPPGMAPLAHQQMTGYYPPNFPIHPNVPPEMHAQMLRTGRIPDKAVGGPTSRIAENSSNNVFTGLIGEPHPSAVISAAPQVVKPVVDKPSTETVISAKPQMRNLKRETTRFVPSSLRVQRPIPTAVGPKIPAGPGTQTITHKMKTGQQRKGAYKSVDDACDDFLKELEGLL